MKAVVITFIIALVVSCLVNGLLNESPPAPQPVGIGDTTEGGFGIKRVESDIPEIGISDGSHPNRFMTSIDDGSIDRNVDWPLGANN
jgi:hypothetical protein